MHRNRTWLVDSTETVLRTQRNRILPIEGGDGSTLSLNFTTGVLDPRLTFTRGSNATFINSSGLVEYAASNQLSNSVLAGASGSTGPTGWLVSFISGTGNFALSGVELTISNNGSATRSRIYQTGPNGNGLFVTVQMRIVANNTGGLSLAEIVSFAINGQTSVTYRVNGVTQLSSYNGWTANDLVTLTCIPTIGQPATCLFGVGVSNNVSTSASITIRDLQIEIGTEARTYNPTTTSGAYYAPRFDHDPTTLAPRGLLIEGTATNLALNGSMAYTATAPTSWARGFNHCTVASVDSTTFPGQKAWSISATAGGQRDFLEQVIALAANTTYTVSIYLEAVTGTTATFAYMSAIPAGATTNTVVNPSAGRVSFTVTVGATAGTGTLRVGIGTATGTTVSADASVRFSHVQVESGSGASSYILTGASQGSRNADHCTMPTSSFITGTLYPQTLFVDCIPATPSSGSLNLVRLFDRTVGTTFSHGNEIYYYTAATMSVNRKVTASTNTDRSLVTALTYNTRHKFATSIDSSAFLGSYDGSTATGATTPAALPTVATHLGVGCNGNATAASVMFGTIRQIKFWPSALSQSAINALTTL